MKRTILAGALVLASLSACLDPPGRCDTAADCGAGQLCLEGICGVPAASGTACSEDLECAPWSTCEAGLCTMLEDRCTDVFDCEEWEACDAEHFCVLAPGRCQSTFDCPNSTTWETCDLARNECVAGDGYCADAEDCEPGQRCDAEHRCVTAG